jgi:hypothetical protein
MLTHCLDALFQNSHAPGQGIIIFEIHKYSFGAKNNGSSLVEAWRSVQYRNFQGEHLLKIGALSGKYQGKRLTRLTLFKKRKFQPEKDKIGYLTPKDNAHGRNEQCPPKLPHY